MESNLNSGENQIMKSGLYFEGNERSLKVSFCHERHDKSCT